MNLKLISVGGLEPSAFCADPLHPALCLVLHATAWETFRFKALLHVGKHEDKQSSLLTFSLHLSLILSKKKYMIGALSPVHGSTVLSPPPSEHSNTIAKSFLKFPRLYTVNIPRNKFALLSPWTEKSVFKKEGRQSHSTWAYALKGTKAPEERLGGSLAFEGWLPQGSP